MRWVCLLLLCGALHGQFRMREVEGDLLYRRDRFAWTISAEGIDILSELTWKNLNIVGARLAAQAAYMGPYMFKAEGMGGYIWKGRDQDSDFGLSGRELEYSRSFSDVDGYVTRASASGGYVISCDPRCRQLMIPSVGVAWHRIHVRSRDGVQVIPPPLTGPGMEPGLNATYTADWVSAYLEIEGRTRLGPCLFLRSLLQIHGGNYLGNGNWVLREMKFSHEAPAFGFVTTMEALMRVSAHVRLTGTFRFEYWNTAQGSDYFNRAEWESLGLEFGALYRF